MPHTDSRSLALRDTLLLRPTCAASLAECTPELAGKQVLVRARVHNARAQGKSAFLVLRSGVTTMQATCFAGKGTPKAMVSFVGAVTKESVVDVLAEVRVAPEEITSCTMKASELAIVNLHVVSRAAPELPFQLDDAARVEERGEGRADLGDEDGVLALIHSPQRRSMLTFP